MLGKSLRRQESMFKKEPCLRFINHSELGQKGSMVLREEIMKENLRPERLKFGNGGNGPKWTRV